ncbi:SPOR domain-containing protein [Pimelobacter simplex]|uniref:SPOR domain-containing protein n=1 Tax=Nocardioides simplex TaxID=2045 RepID=UPI0019331BC0|nr:hypothetical protein [Pimelobacter simplex]
MTAHEGPPEGYIEPITAWSVEYVDPSEPEVGSHQVGAFTTETEAVRLRQRLATGGFFAELHINIIPVHRRVEDWEWDR